MKIDVGQVKVLLSDQFGLSWRYINVIVKFHINIAFHEIIEKKTTRF